MDSIKKLSELTILVVEDNAFTSIVICKSLKSLGISHIKTVADGREALDNISELQPDVILLDLRMPVMGGVELLSRLSDRQHDGHIILMSGVEADTLTSVEQVAREGNVSILGSLQKPPNASDLSNLLLTIYSE